MRRYWLWGLLLGSPLLCCGVFMVIGALTPKPPPVVNPGLEPEGTCAFEGYLIDMPKSASDPYPVTLMLNDGVLPRAYPVNATREGDFRLAGVPCDGGDHGFGIAVQTNDGRRGGKLHSTIGGNTIWLSGRSGTRFLGVKLELDDGLTFRGRVVDDGGTPLEGVTVSPGYVTYGRDGWSPPGTFTITSADGTFFLQGVEASRMPKDLTPLWLYKEGFQTKEVLDAGPGKVGDLTLDPLPVP